MLIKHKLLKDLMNVSEKCFLEKRQLHSLEAHILKDILWATTDYKNFCRMNIDDFEHLLSLVSESNLSKLIKIIN